MSKLRAIKKLRLKIVWSKDKLTQQLADKKVKDSIDKWNKWRIFDRVALSRELLSATFPDSPDMKPFLVFQCTDEERFGGSFSLYIWYDGSAWIQWEVSATDLTLRTIEKHGLPPNWRIISHSVAHIEEVDS